ncbi:hypothetical protein L1987_50253 [Smallanthus sonchifolius]|uniref:Uncharacterized protein n=1 Tax=Smallanthus sonchifolius TaxID=185202 RepID=A0ACB9ELQ8_9ASTR|nr:hypothetical protein L1987_50253 [Smallanthus sonchifolius]
MRQVVLPSHVIPGHKVLEGRHGIPGKRNCLHNSVIAVNGYRKLSRHPKMVEMTDLPFDILKLIIVMVATSADGARDIAQICKKLKTLSKQACVLKVVNFQGLAFFDDCRMHHHPDNLLCQCARFGNQAAESILGKAFLNNDTWFWNMILANNQPALNENGSSSRPLQHPRLVRSFILHGSSKDIAKMCHSLCSYMKRFVGYEAVRAHGMVGAITSLCSYEHKRFRIIACLGCATENFRSDPSFPPLDNLVAMIMPPHDVVLREEVLVIFDNLFPSTPL